MSLLYSERPAESPYVERIFQLTTLRADWPIRPAETHWHLVLARREGQFLPFVVGPWLASGRVQIPDGADILYIKFSLGTFMPHLPANAIADRELLMGEGAWNTFWLAGATWECPDFENADSLVERLVRAEVLVHDPLVSRALREEPLGDVAPRTVRHRFLRATGQSLRHLQQARRAMQAADLLEQGVSILDTVATLGYFDQPHLTRALKRFVGHTPAQIAARATASCQIVQDAHTPVGYPERHSINLS